MPDGQPVYETRTVMKRSKAIIKEKLFRSVFKSTGKKINVVFRSVSIKYYTSAINVTYS